MDGAGDAGVSCRHQHPAALSANAKPVDVFARPSVVDDEEHLPVLQQAPQMSLIIASLAGTEVVVAQRHDPLAEERTHLRVLAEGCPENAVVKVIADVRLAHKVGGE